MDDKLETYLGEVDPGRRDLLKRLILGAAFVAPVATTFGLGPANAQVSSCLLSNSFESGPGMSRFGTTQNRDCPIQHSGDLPKGLDDVESFSRFPRDEEVRDGGKIIFPH